MQKKTSGERYDEQRAGFIHQVFDEIYQRVYVHLLEVLELLDNRKNG